jgi:hypothetical protein
MSMSSENVFDLLVAEDDLQLDDGADNDEQRAAFDAIPIPCND